MKLSKIKIIKLDVYRNFQGDLIKYLNCHNKYFKKFGETYFTEIKKNYVKGWNYHKRLQCLVAVPFGEVVFTFKTNIKNKLKKKLIIGKKKNYLIIVPPKIWFKFQSTHKISLVVNTLSELYDPKETLKKPID